MIQCFVTNNNILFL